MKTSAVPNFSRLSPNERINIISDFCDLDEDDRKKFEGFEEMRYTENGVGYFPNVLRFANNFKINGRDYFVPMVTEEASVVAGASYGAKLCYESGGIESLVKDSGFSKSIGQIQLMDVRNPEKAARKILEKKEYLLKKAGEKHKHSLPYNLDVNRIDSDIGSMLIVNLHIDPGNSMGAAVASEMADYIVPEISKITNSKFNRGIVSNYSGRLTEAKLKVPVENLSRESKTSKKCWGGEEVKNNIMWLDRWAKHDRNRAATNNKGIMNGAIAVARAVAQDDRAIEAANSCYASRDGYQPLSTWDADNDYLYGNLEMVVPCGTVGGEIKNHPKAKFILERVLKVKDADELAEIIAAAGISSNLAALSMISSIGPEGHKLHRK